VRGLELDPAAAEVWPVYDRARLCAGPEERVVRVDRNGRNGRAKVEVEDRLPVLVEEVVITLDCEPVSREELRRDGPAERADERLGRPASRMPDEERRCLRCAASAVVSVRRDRNPRAPGCNTRDEIRVPSASGGFVTWTGPLTQSGSTFSPPSGNGRVSRRWCDPSAFIVQISDAYRPTPVSAWRTKAMLFPSGDQAGDSS
jgi:hypothetical protein